MPYCKKTILNNVLKQFQMLTYLMVARVAQLCPGAVLTKLDKLVEPLKLTVTTKVSILSLFMNHSIYKKKFEFLPHKFYSPAVQCNKLF